MMSTTSRRPSLPPMPDLSHLDEAERKQIEEVLRRQHEEEEREQEMIRKMQHDFDAYRQSVDKINLEAKKLGPQGQLDTGAVCQICHKTKFADGVGHVCHYCQLKSCARCGGRMTVKQNKKLDDKTAPPVNNPPTTVWSCNLCRKKQDLLAKTGAWYHGGMAKPVQLGLDTQTESDTASIKAEISPPNEKRPKIYEKKADGTISGSDKENIKSGPRGPHPHPKEGIRRQTSLDTGSSQHSRGRLNEQYALTPEDGEKFREHGQVTERGRNRDRSPASRRHYSETRLSETDRRFAQEFRHGDRLGRGEGTSRSRDPSRERGPRDDMKRGRDTHPDKRVRDGPRDLRDERHRDPHRSEHDIVYKRSKDPDHYRQSPVEGIKGHDYADKETIRGSREHVDMLDGEKRRTRDSSLSKVNNMQAPSSGKLDRSGSGRLSRPERTPNVSSSRRSPTTSEREKGKEGLDMYHGESPSPRSPSVSSRHKMRNVSPTVKDESGRANNGAYSYSVSSHLDPSAAAGRNLTKNNNNNSRKKMENLRADSLSSDPSDCARPPPPKPHKHRKGNKKQRQHSLSSSDDEIRSTPENSSYEGEEESESIVSEKANVCLGELEMGEERWRKDEILAAKIKKFLSHPVTWKLSSDGSTYVGHMILKKTIDGARQDDCAILGLSIVGGRETPLGQHGAYITKVKKGSIADTVGHLRPGDEVLEFNGRCLQRATFEEVRDIIMESKQEPQVELIVHRNAISGEVPPGLQQSDHNTRRSPLDHDQRGKRVKDYTNGHGRRPNLSETTPLPSSSRSRTQTSKSMGKIQLKLWYNVKGQELILTIISATNLPPTTKGQFRHPYCKVYLLPDRSEKSRRRTKTVMNSNEPTWNQTFMYDGVTIADLRNSLLEITVWDYDRMGPSEFLGEVLLDLHSANLEDDPFWYPLSQHDESSLPLPQSSPRTKTHQEAYYGRKDHLSPPVSSRGHSDSDMSEFDMDERFMGNIPAEVCRLDKTSSCSSYGSSVGSDEYSDPTDYRYSHIRTRPIPILKSQFRPAISPLALEVPIAKEDPVTRLREAIVSSREEHERSHRHPKTAVEKLSVPGEQSPHQRSTSPKPPDIHTRNRSRTPSSSYHRVPETVTRSLSPPDLSSSPSRLMANSPSNTPSPKKRQLPAIPTDAQRESRDRVVRDLEERARQIKSRMRPGSVTPNLSDSEAMRGRHSRTYDRSISRERGYPQYDRDLSRGRRKDLGNEYDIPSDGDSDISEISKVSTISVRSTQSEKPHRKFSQFKEKINTKSTIPRQQQPSVRTPTGDSQGFQKQSSSGSMSDSEVGSCVTEGRRRRPSLGHKIGSLIGLQRRSSSASQLSDGKKKSSIQRSEEVLSGRGLVKQPSKDSTDGSIGSISSDSGSVLWLNPAGMRLGPEGQFGDFIDGLGPAQLVGRQVLGSACLGEIQLSLYDRKHHLEVEVIRARGLIPKAGAKILPAPYVKVYLIDGKHCVEKQKTTVARRTLDPLYQQQLAFTEDYRGKILQVTVWGDYGRMDRKVFMGVAQILLDHLDLSNIVIGWYKLFTSSSLAGHHSSSSTIGHSRKGSTTSLDSGYNNNSPRT
ncbi:regulating synaptic membrane exocytosis protein 1-like isoform X4 [Saccostrea echinata]|uniref:regulating synaptic membrane exocytosis protein 1-like isoform X4 n=1 Tax=Saccostrea echinata TaxID=191078 RepID=UPI002A809EFC|nr:regulating synaptic membrane exocytosis protein 1-like isoform X4 [Saccostrea echinata]